MSQCDMQCEAQYNVFSMVVVDEYLTAMTGANVTCNVKLSTILLYYFVSFKIIHLPYECQGLILGSQTMHSLLLSMINV